MEIRSVARKHHYVPQGYLAAFTDTGTKDGKFHVLDVQSGHSFRTSPGNVAAQRDFNRVDIEGRSPDALENALAPFEGQAIAAIRRVIETRAHPRDKDWNLIVNLLTLIAVRNPRLRESFNRSREQVLRRTSELLVSDRSLWERHAEMARKAGEDLPDVSYERAKAFVEEGQYDIVFSPEGNLRIEFDTFDKVLPLLGRRQWSLLVAPDEGPEFICCDHPVTLTWKGARRGPIGYGLEHTEVFFPLGRRVGLYGVFESPINEVVHCRPKSVGIMNRHVLNSAERHVYSARDKFVIWAKGGLHEIQCQG